MSDKKILDCVKCSNPADAGLLCTACLHLEEEAFFEPLPMQCQEIIDHKYGKEENLGNKCIECGSIAMTLENGVCNTCLSKKDKDDMIKWPSHYNTGKIQPIDVIEDWKLDFRLASALKYIARAGKKDPTKTKQDLEKCIWYVQRYIDKELK